MAHSDTVLPYEKLPSGTQTTSSSLVSSIYQSVSLSFIRPLLKKGAANDLNENSAILVNPMKESVEELTNRFTQLYNKDSNNIRTDTLLNPVLCALIKQHKFLLSMQFLWTTLWTCSRLFRSVAIRWFLMWLSDYKDGDAKASEGWFWGLLMILSTVAMTLFDTHTFWTACKSGWKMKMSMMAALHAKLLRLNSSSVAQITAGHIVNLASNDVQRFMEAATFWPYLVLSPAESISILVMLSFVLGFVPAISGMSCVFVLVPLQSFFSRQIGHYRTKSARVTDQRINFMSELITGHLAVKMLGWEDTILDKLHGIRKKEHSLLKRMNCIKANALAMVAYIQLVMACVAFVVYRFTSEEFNVPDVLFAISLFNLPAVFMASFFPSAMQSFSELLVATRRIHTFFRLPEVNQSFSTKDTVRTGGEITIENGNYGWYSTQSGEDTHQEQTTILEWILAKVGWKRKTMHQQESPSLIQTLTDIGFHVKSGEFLGIAGTVGSGKSSLLSALLNDMENLNPEHIAQITGSMSYCAQVPWIMAATVQDNIVFGNEFNQCLYDRVVSSCALDIDIMQLPYGDQTEIGERGINLSGGQKARVALARAAYCKADVNLLDDPLSAVDPKVGRILFDKCIGGDDGLMKDSTRLLVTHQKQFLPLCDRIIIMNNGQIAYIGTWSDLSDDHLLKDMELSYGSVDACMEEPSSSQIKAGQKDMNFSAKSDCNSQPRSEIVEDSKQPETSTKQQLVDAEEKMYGRVPLKVYWEYSKFIGVVPLLLALFVMVIGKGLHFCTDWWIAAWASTDSQGQREQKWIRVLVGLTITVATSVTVGMFILLGLCIGGSTSLHKQMAKRVMFAPLSFFHRNPSGRILNRFSKDIGIQDDELPANFGDVLTSTLHIAGSIIVVCIALPYLTPVIILTLVGLRKLGNYYVMTAREVRRYCAITRSPVYTMLSSNIKALPTVRAFRKEQEFQSAFLKALNLNGSWEIAYLAASLWAALRMDAFLIVVYILFVMLSVPLCDKVSVRLIGLALVYIVTLSGKFQWWTRQSAELANRMTSVERNLEYTQLNQEPPRASEGGGEAPTDWPSKGTVEYSLVSASYRPGLEPVLKQLQFVIRGGSSVGIVGRTGSGKSTLLLTLLRLIGIDTGRIFIDGVDTSTIGIDVLRKQLSVIPQDPFLFAGTLRSNLDPWCEYSDAQIWSVLDKVHLSEACKAFGGISAPVAECGDNLSVGQRQLLCLARALLTDSKILALDEATANVDRNTDALIQDTLHALISTHEKTLLIIAHRVDTVLDCDLVLVLDGGRVVEFGSPSSLLSQSEGVFKRMVDAAREAAYIKSHDAQT